MLRGKSIMITGAGSGIGQKCAEVFAANAAMFLLSDMSSFMTGAPMLVDGGYSV